MIQITFTHSIKPDNPATDIATIVQLGVIEIYDEMQTRLKQLIAENVILNCSITMIDDHNQLLFSHFATTPENAQLFISQYVSDTADTVAFWQPYGIDWKLDQQEIDFDTIDPLTMTMLIDDNDILYGLPIPGRTTSLEKTISSPSRSVVNQG